MRSAMKIRYRVAALAAILCLTAASAAMAQRPLPTPQQTFEPGVPVVKIRPEASLPACVLGISGVPDAAIGYILPPDDAYYTYLPSADCPDCAGEPRLYTFAHVGLFFANHCSVPVTVSIVGGSVGACPRPDPAAVLCPPVTYTINSMAMGIPLNVPVDITLPITANCCLDGDVWLKIEYDQGTCNFNNLGFLSVAPPCSNCTQYNFYPGGNDDLCPILGGAGYGLFIQNVEAECCGGTPVDAATIGRVKSMYR
jgi:hypothetical protein